MYIIYLMSYCSTENNPCVDRILVYRVNLTAGKDIFEYHCISRQEWENQGGE
jgi:hypothetical protein